MKVLIACEYSGRVRDEFIARGHDAISCDLRSTESKGPHYQGDVFDLINWPRSERFEFEDGNGRTRCWFPSGPKGNTLGFDLLIAHPYCTFNCLSGIRWMYHPEDTALPAEQRRRHPKFPDRMEKFIDGVNFFNALKNCAIPKKCLENSQPHGLAMQHIGRYTQVVQPWMFGDPVTKGAYLWLEGLPPLIAKNKKSDFESIRAECHMMPPGPERERERSRTRVSIAKAMAEHWG